MDTICASLALCEENSPGTWVLNHDWTAMRCFGMYLLLTWLSCWTNRRYVGDLIRHNNNVTESKGVRFYYVIRHHYSDVTMSAMESQITGESMICSTVCSGSDQRKHQSSASLTFVRGIHRWLVVYPHKGPVTWKMLPFDDVIMIT